MSESDLRMSNAVEVSVKNTEVAIKDLRGDFILWLSYKDVEVLSNFLNKHKETLKTNYIKNLEKQKNDLYQQLVLIEKELDELNQS